MEKLKSCSFYFASKSIIKKYFIFLFFATAVFITNGFFVSSVFAEEVINNSYPIEGYYKVSGKGTLFRINIDDDSILEVETQIPINLRIDASDKMIIIENESLGTEATTSITISNLHPLTTYYKYSDSYLNLEAIITDTTGSLTYQQNINDFHSVFIQTIKSTKFIRPTSTGGDCSSIGIWDNTTKTCVLTQDVFETIQIEGDGIVLDGAGHTIQGYSVGFGVYVPEKSNVTIKNLIIKGFFWAINATQTSQSNFLNNIFEDNVRGGILFSSSQNITLQNNQFIDDDFYVAGNTVNDFTHSIDISNTIDGKPILYLVDTHDEEYHGLSVNAFYCISCKNVLFEGSTFTANDAHIFLYNTNSTVIKNVEMQSNTSYISLNNSTLNTIEGNIIHRTYNSAIVLNFSTENKILHNTVSGSEPIALYQSSNNNLIEYNNTTGASSGIYISGSNDNIIQFNESYQSGSGISLNHGAIGNDIHDNNFLENNNGFRLSSYSANDNLIYNNNFIGNLNVLENNGKSQQIFYKDLPIGGNYWSDFNSPSEGCNDENKDGVCDLERIINDNNKDLFPWMYKNGWKGERVPEEEEGYSSIIFVPGFEGSRLYEKRNNGNLIQRWEAAIVSLTDVNSLYLDNLGNSIKSIFVGDVIERTNYIPDSINTNFYNSIANWFRETKESSIINDFFMFPYDWRLDVSDLAQNGSVSTNNEILNLKDKIIELSQNSKTNKITLIGHSNGGLLIKKTIQLLKDSGQENLLDKVILVGSPQLGTPKAIGAMLHGDGASLGGGFVLSSEKARSWGENMPGVYGLIPSEKYYQKVGSIVSFDESLNNNWISLYGDVLDYEEQNNFLTGQDGRKKPASDNLEFPTILNESLLNRANELHDDIDNLEFPDDIKFYEIAGVGVPTLERLTYKSRLLGTVPVDYKLNFSCDGDKTVVSQSAVDSDLNPYYLNLFDYRKDTENKFSHSDLMENPEIINLISNITTDTNKDISHITTTKPSLSECKFKIFGIFSPANLDVYDSERRHTGINRDISTNNFMAFDTEIPNSDFFIIGDQKYVVVPDEGEYNVKIDGTGTGVFTLDITTQENDQIINNTSYNNIPVNPKLEAQIVVNSNNSEEMVLKIDSNGDGKIDQQVSPNNEENPLHYLKSIRKMIIELNLPKKIEKPLLQKIDKIIKSILKNKHYHTEKNIEKFMKKIELNKKFIKKFTQKDRNNLVEQINNLLNSF